MLFTVDTLQRIASGEVTLAFRLWTRPAARPGGRQRTSIGELTIDAVEPVEAAAISLDEARAVGFADRDALFALLASPSGRSRRPPEGCAEDRTLYRVAFHIAGPDRRIALREAGELDAGSRAEISIRLARLDAANRDGPWTAATLAIIEANPGLRAGDLAEQLGRQRLTFKANVRKLKELGLTESLEVGYRLTPRGQAWFASA